MDQVWTQIGIGGILALLVIREFSTLLRHFIDRKMLSNDKENKEAQPMLQSICAECRRRIEETHMMVNEIGQRKQRIEEIHTQVRELHEMHNHKDGDGVFVWYVKRSLEDSIDKLAEATSRQTLLLEKFFDQYARDAEERRHTSHP